MSTDPLIQHLDAFIGFARSRTGDPELAADLVQECLMKALKADNVPEDAEGVVTWFYRVLRHAIIDAHRRRTTRDQALEKLVHELPEALEPEDEAPPRAAGGGCRTATPHRSRRRIGHRDRDCDEPTREHAQCAAAPCPPKIA
jgi:RNA polymerase sigma factor (sigma-70 family)